MAAIELFHYLRNLYLTYDQWASVFKRFTQELDKVHSKTDWTKATLKCTPSSLYRLPNHEEYLECLGIALGAKLNCFYVTLHGKPENAIIINESFQIPKGLQQSAEDDFFDFIIDCVYRFAQKHDVEKLFLPLGITFKLPNFSDKDLDKIYSRFHKAFRQGGPERDVVNLLLTVSLTKNLELETCKYIMVNQTSASLMQAIALVNPKCRLILTEYGAAYVAKTDNLDLLTNEQKRKGSHTVMELDWSEFADGDLLDDMLNPFDVKKDHAFEKMIAAKYRCEAFQKIVLRIVEKNILFPMHTDRLRFINILKKGGCFDVDDLEKIEEDSCPEFEITKAFVEKVFGDKYASFEDCFKLQYISQSLAKRATQMIAIILSSIINKLNMNDVVIGLDDRLFRLKERYKIISDTMFLIVRPSIHYEIIHVPQQLGTAAAIAAAMSVGS